MEDNYSYVSNMFAKEFIMVILLNKEIARLMSLKQLSGKVHKLYKFCSILRARITSDEIIELILLEVLICPFHKSYSCVQGFVCLISKYCSCCFMRFLRICPPGGNFIIQYFFSSITGSLKFEPKIGKHIFDKYFVINLSTFNYLQIPLEFKALLHKALFRATISKKGYINLSR